MNGNASYYPKLDNGGRVVIPGISFHGRDLLLNPRKNQLLRASPPAKAWHLSDSLEKRVRAEASAAQPWVCKERSDCVVLGTQETVVPRRVELAS